MFLFSGWQICIETWLKDHSTCPSCRKTVLMSGLKPVMPMVQNLLNKLTLRCANYDNGCMTPVPLERYLAHVDGCPLASVHCCYEVSDIFSWLVLAISQYIMWIGRMCRVFPGLKIGSGGRSCGWICGMHGYEITEILLFFVFEYGFLVHSN